MTNGQNSNQVFSDAWNLIQPHLQTIKDSVGYRFQNARVRGYNTRSESSPDQGELQIWVNIRDHSDDDNPVPLFEAAGRVIEQLDVQAAFAQIWQILFAEIGDDLDHVVLTPPGSGPYAVGMAMNLVPSSKKSTVVFKVE